MSEWSAVAARLLPSRVALAIVFVLGWSSALAGHGHDPDRVRLHSYANAPDPFSIPDQVTTLSTVIAVRKVAGLGQGESRGDDADCDEDRSGRRNHSKTFWVKVWWTVRAPSGGSVQISKQVQVLPPLDFVKLQTEDGKKRFALVPVNLVWDGRDAHSAFVPDGSYAFDLQAQYIRSHDHGGQTREIIVDDTGIATGTVTVRRSVPSPPSVNAYPLSTNVPLITFSGGKPANTALLINGVERLALNASVTWTTTQTLVEGANVFQISDRNVHGLESLSVTVPVTLVTVPPPPPVVSVPPEFTSTRTVTLTGSKEAGTAILVNGTVVVPASNSTTWSTTVILEEGANNLVIESMDSVGNKSLAAGSHLAGVADEKPVIRDLSVSPPEVSTGQSVQVSYRLFAANPPSESGTLNISVRVEAGDLLVKELWTGVQEGNPTGPTFSAMWDGTDTQGQPAMVNASYRIVVSGSRVAPTSSPRELVDPNRKETAVLVIGSQHITSANQRLEIIFRPDDAKLKIAPFPVLSARASRLLTSRSLHPQMGCYRITIDRPFSGAAVGVLKCPDGDGRLVRPFWWDETLQDWSPVGRSNWNPAARQLSFSLPGPGLLVFATTNDVDQPYVTSVAHVGSEVKLRVRDDTSGIDTRHLRFRQNGQDIGARASQQMLNGVHDIQVTLSGVASLESLTVYAEDWAGHGQLFHLDERTAP